ncbi:histidine kinase dimerization/phospho-acceptor domain-containing protein [Erythrobacter sp. F6033]|uniref:histidine kinase dimerization/phospho-acceptor domain-containing protein n=1 Tax=Erythrobacter sp. F6033 TaxID=2926401 RepID=UPI001FF24C54|nr:histidine kinase dimerization/phospho-acceptor domain-containing protein [Erythrobacter sp. F6033]MCK0128751.1 sensor histidine kinase [Erythrobacter sp. F6033]
MFFDDRLATVLRQRATSEAGARTQFRQLLDILGNRKFAPQDERSGSLIAAAWLRMDALAEELPPADRAAMIRETGWRFRSPDLAAHLADHEPEVASAALNRAHLSAEDWEALIPRLPVRARGFLRLRRDLPVDTEALLERLGVHDRGLPSPHARQEAPEERIPAAPVEAAAEREQFEAEPEATSDQIDPVAELQDPFDPADSGRSEISALVERIAQFRKTRDVAPSDVERSPKLPLGLEERTGAGDRRISAFGFSADANGRIDWAETEAAAMVTGVRLTRPSVLGGRDNENEVERAFHRRLPISHCEFSLRGAPAIEGDWIVDAQPSFTDDGSFSGYLGRFRRPANDDPNAPTAEAREADRIRQLLHELRTPVTAVQGYAEVIQQQLFGPAPHDYRALAAAIAADAARILSGFEELDRLAKLETGAMTMEPGEADLSAIAHATSNQLAQVLGTRMAGIEFGKEPEGPVFVALDSEDAEALLWRLMATLGGNCASGENLVASLEAGFTEARLTCDLPAQLMSEEDVFAAEAKPVGDTINAGLFGAGFSLRLARAEARAAGGALSIKDDTVTLTLPLLTARQALPSQTERGERDNVA